MAPGRNRHGYDDSNRAFLQALMSRSTMTAEELKPILAAILTVRNGEPVSADDVTEDDVSTYIHDANSAISPFDLEIRTTLRQTQMNPETSENFVPERVYALVNTTSDGLTQLATTYTADEIAFVKRVLDTMFETNNDRITEAMVVSSIEAVQLAKAPADPNRRDPAPPSQGTPQTPTQTQGGVAQSLTMSQAETMMKQLVEDGWMEKSRKGYYSLSPRGLMELRGWLVATYNDDNEDGRRVDKIKFCSACRDIITVGQRCGSRECKGRLHDHCVRNVFRVQKAERCPVCKSPWPGDKFVGERAITSRQNRRQTNNTPRRSEAGMGIQLPEIDEGGSD